MTKRSLGYLHTRLLLSTLLVMACTGCATHSSFSIPFQNNEAFSSSGTEALEEYWWHSLNDEKLDDHIQTALSNNFSLGAAWERLNAARALATREASNLYPKLNLQGNISRRIEDSDGDKSFSTGPAASYELDLWGRIRASAAAEDLRAAASLEAYRTAALTLSSDIALTWIRLIETQNQRDLLLRQIETNEKVLEILKARFGIGQVRSEDILRQQLLIEALKEEKIEVEVDFETLENQLAVLKGEAPQNTSYSLSSKLPSLTALPKTGLPSELISRRPDIRASLLQIEAADKYLAAAVRDQYPTINLSTSYISEAATAGSLFSDWITTLAGGIVAPIIDGGQRRAEVNRTEALRNEQVQLYAQNVLQAFQEVEDALIREEKQNERIENLENRLRLARNTLEQIQTGYLNGANDFISLLGAQVELQDIERDLLQANRNLIEFRISLYRALAGGFKTPREKSEDMNEKEQSEDEA